MGRQSSRIAHGLFDHKQIVKGGYDHVQVWHNGELVWEKLNDTFTGDFSFIGSALTTILIAGDFEIDWGDGTVEKYELPTLTTIYHDTTNNFPTIKIKGAITDISFRSNNKIREFLSPLPKSLSLKEDFSQMFAYSTSFSKIPNDMFSNCENAKSFQGCFANSGLEEIPEGLFDNCKMVTNYGSCFIGAKVKEIPHTLFHNSIQAENFASCFSGTEIREIPNDLFLFTPNVTDMSNCFRSTNITSIPEGLFDNFDKVSTYKGTFAYCEKLKSIPELLFEKSKNVKDFTQTFFGASSVTSKVPELWLRDNVELHSECFYGCTNAENHFYIPSDWR